MDIETGSPILKLSGISLHFGGVKALTDVSFDVRKGEILSIIGPNGAGKTCILNCINQFYQPQKGEVSFMGQKITGMASHKIARMGISRTFQNIELFNGLTVQDNLMSGRHFFMTGGFWGAFLGGIYYGPAHREEIKQRRIVEEIIDFLEIESIRKQTVGTLPTACASAWSWDGRWHWGPRCC